MSPIKLTVRPEMRRFMDLITGGAKNVKVLSDKQIWEQKVQELRGQVERCFSADLGEAGSAALDVYTLAVQDEVWARIERVLRVTYGLTFANGQFWLEYDLERHGCNTVRGAVDEAERALEEDGHA